MGRTWPDRRHLSSTQTVLLDVGLLLRRRNAGHSILLTLTAQTTFESTAPWGGHKARHPINAAKQAAAHSALRHQQPYKSHRRIGSQCQNRSGTSYALGSPSRRPAKGSTGWTAAKSPARASKAALKGSVEPRSSSRCSGTVFWEVNMTAHLRCGRRLPARSRRGLILERESPKSQPG